VERADAVLDHAYRLDPEFQPEDDEDVGGEDPEAGVPMDARGPQTDPSVLELGEGDWTWKPPAASDPADLSPLEMSLQPDGPEEGAPRRFLPAVTAEGRHGRETTAPHHRTVTTQELDLSDLIYLEQHRAAVTAVTTTPQRRSQRTVTTTELDLADLEEVQEAPLATQELEPDELEVVDEPTVTGGRTLNTSERAMSELGELAGELSDRYLGLSSTPSGSSRDKETVKVRRRPAGGTTDPDGRPDGPEEKTRRASSPKERSAERAGTRGRQTRRPPR
jgi:hypothetical protein